MYLSNITGVAKGHISQEPIHEIMRGCWNNVEEKKFTLKLSVMLWTYFYTRISL